MANRRCTSGSPFWISAFSLWLHRAGTYARASHQMSARFRPRTMTDSPALQPLHSLPHSAAQITRDAFAHSDGHKLARQSGHKSCAPQSSAGVSPAKSVTNIRPRCSAYRPGKQYGRVTSSGQNSNSPRVVARGQDHQQYGRKASPRPRHQQ